ncbi:hypothetical protein GCM10027159_12390 [Lysobacter terrae]
MTATANPEPCGAITVARDLKTVSQFASGSVWSEASLRWMIFQAARNGLADVGAIVRCGRRVFIDPAAFDRWLVAQNPNLQSDERNAQVGAR